MLEQLSFGRRFLRSKQGMAGLLIVLLNIGLACFAPRIVPYDFDEMDFGAMLAEPGTEGHCLGTDDMGRDVLTRLIYGSQVSLMVGMVAVSIGACLGTVLGLISGYFGGFFDALLMRLMDALLAFPYILLAIAMMAALGAGLFNAMLAIGLVMVPSFARVVRGAVLNVKNEDFITGVRIMGASHLWILARHVLVNVLPPIIVYASLSFAGAIISEATLSFLGLGIQPPVPSWGSMLSEAMPYMDQASYLAVLPGLAILVTCLGFNLLGDGLRDVLDPRLRIR
ncbi:ABC transporter permease [uncultured Fretibacterium sp.]|uniref:ABC transporter permease n=1 Tax=uncultured Fretibacterium sp. TaxID=1678694 RepID=UPI00325F9EF7